MSETYCDELKTETKTKKPINLINVSSSSGSESDSGPESDTSSIFENVSKQVNGVNAGDRQKVTDWLSLHYQVDMGTNVKLSSIFDHYKK